MVLFAILSGLCFSIIAVTYRAGAVRGVGPIHVMGTCSLAGTLFFGLRAAGSIEGDLPGRVLALGTLAGVSQYAMLPLIRTGLRLGPLSPLWCVLMLGFIPATLYAYAALGETLGPAHYAAIVAAVGCVGLAMVGKGGGVAPASSGVPARSHRFEYAIVLVSLLVLGGVSSSCVKDLSVRSAGPDGTWMARYGDLFLAMLYGGIALCSAADVLLARRRPASWRWTAGLGAVAAVGSLTGMSLLVRAAVLPAAVVFTVSSVTSLLCTAMWAAVLFRERRSWSWYATLACGLLAVALANAEAIWAYLGLCHM